MARSQEKFWERRRGVFRLLFSPRLPFQGFEEREEHLMEDVIYLSDHVGEKSDLKYLEVVQVRFILIFEQIRELRQHIVPPDEAEEARKWGQNDHHYDLRLVWEELEQIEQEMREDLKWMAQRCRRELREPS